MPSDEYTSASGGALRLKGAKVEKHKKKHKKRSREEKERRAQRADEERGADDRDDGREKKKGKKKTGSDNEDGAAEPDDHDPYAHMTPAERSFAEAQDKKIRDLLHASPDEARAAHPELFKSHKERLADLNTYLSRMSEHNDMPKIGPG